MALSVLNKPFCHAAVVRFGGQIMTCIQGLRHAIAVFLKKSPEAGVLRIKISIGRDWSQCVALMGACRLWGIKF